MINKLCLARVKLHLALCIAKKIPNIKSSALINEENVAICIYYISYQETYSQVTIHLMFAVMVAVAT